VGHDDLVPQPAQVPAHPWRMLPGFDCHAAGWQSTERLAQSFLGCCSTPLEEDLARLVQHAIPTGSISQVHSDRQLLALPSPFPIPDSNAILPHCRSPFHCTVECVHAFGSLTHPGGDRLSHPIWMVGYSSSTFLAGAQLCAKPRTWKSTVRLRRDTRPAKCRWVPSRN